MEFLLVPENIAMFVVYGDLFFAIYNIKDRVIKL